MVNIGIILIIVASVMFILGAVFLGLAYYYHGSDRNQVGTYRDSNGNTQTRPAPPPGPSPDATPTQTSNQDKYIGFLVGGILGMVSAFGLLGVGVFMLIRHHHHGISSHAIPTHVYDHVHYDNLHHM